jgi:hypothetical protein
MRGIIEPEGPPAPDAPPPPLVSRLMWFAVLTFAGVGATAAVAYGLRWLLHLS